MAHLFIKMDCMPRLINQTFDKSKQIDKLLQNRYYF